MVGVELREPRRVVEAMASTRVHERLGEDAFGRAQIVRAEVEIVVGDEVGCDLD